MSPSLVFSRTMSARDRGRLCSVLVVSHMSSIIGAYGGLSRGSFWPQRGKVVIDTQPAGNLCITPSSRRKPKSRPRLSMGASLQIPAFSPSPQPSPVKGEGVTHSHPNPRWSRRGSYALSPQPSLVKGEGVTHSPPNLRSSRRGGYALSPQPSLVKGEGVTHSHPNPRSSRERVLRTLHPDPPPDLHGWRDGLPLRLRLCTLPEMGSRPRLLGGRLFGGTTEVGDLGSTPTVSVQGGGG